MTTAAHRAFNTVVLCLAAVILGGCALNAFRPLTEETGRGAAHPAMNACLTETGERYRSIQAPWAAEVVACISRRLEALPAEEARCRLGGAEAVACTAWIAFRAHDLTFTVFVDNRYEIAAQRQAGGRVDVEMTLRRYWSGGLIEELRQADLFFRP